MHAQLLIEFHFKVVLVCGGRIAILRGRGRDGLLALCGELVAVAYHFDEFAAAELEVDVFVVAEDGGVVGIGVLEGFVDVAFEDECADFWDLLAHNYFKSGVDRLCRFSASRSSTGWLYGMSASPSLANALASSIASSANARAVSTYPS